MHLVMKTGQNSMIQINDIVTHPIQNRYNAIKNALKDDGSGTSHGGASVSLSQASDVLPDKVGAAHGLLN